MARLFKKKQAQQEMEVDLTPMLDVVFIMLIFFIVTASFVQEDGFRVNRPPESDSQTPPTDKNATFIVTETDEIWLEGRRIDVRSVRANVERILAENPEASVTVRAHNLATAGVYVGITDQATEAVGNRADFAVNLVTYGE